MWPNSTEIYEVVLKNKSMQHMFICYLLQIGKIKELSKLFLQLWFRHSPVIQQFHSVLFHLNPNKTNKHTCRGAVKKSRCSVAEAQFYPPHVALWCAAL